MLRDLPQTWLALVSSVGGGVVFYLGIDTLRNRQRDQASEDERPPASQDLWRGALVNFLNPHPWIFWITVEGPLLIQGWRRHPWIGLAFVASFYLSIVGSKILIAWLVSHSRRNLKERWYRRVLSVCGLALLGLGLLLIFDGVGDLLEPID